ncbi:hypothetical protein I3760_04G123000 [Carya illinoinensis]|nr:hypothetical protein I3760_04G123000 [Carya illinoinensis]
MERNEDQIMPILETGQAAIWQLLFAFADSMALKCAVELRIADIIHSHDIPVTLNQIASEIDSPTSPDIPYLARIMRSLVHKKIFTETHLPDGCDTLYGSTETSRWLLHDAELSLVPMVIMENNPWQLAPWHCLSQSHGCEMWDFAAKNPEFNKIFNDAMACMTKIVMGVVLTEYKDGFNSIGSLVDIGGVSHVVATAPLRQGVSHVGGNMFKAIPSADAIFMKCVLHDWSNEHCIKTLKNCKKAIPPKSGKVIIVDIVLEKENDDLYQETRMVFDLLMMAHTTGGTERTELEWKQLLTDAGFPRYKIIKIPCDNNAYPDM